MVLVFCTRTHNTSAKEKEIRNLLANAYKKLDLDKSMKHEEVWEEIVYYEESLNMHSLLKISVAESIH
ncbi:hypothetical protein LZP85_02810 [Priestia flexa]|uniref:hypothetical protein n=1 Tax=Bacillaceae TaxID=186817 RepID=UPI00104F9DE9|nr:MULTISPECIES: hypothetical protein [Bacillaceae]TDB53161.1 hypothetical protein EPL02_06590 [Bacillus sp. CBEL-1]UIR30736.1 hypothetical protein LZP85_02810 [Priestia flexa]